tara:strand:- start:114 stop:392 length:279 start_codon:yes stop_codon:yes gene_type:complete
VGETVVALAAVVVDAAVVALAAVVVGAPAAMVVETDTPEETVGEVSVGVESLRCSSNSSIRCFNASNSEELDPPQADPSNTKTNKAFLDNII